MPKHEIEIIEVTDLGLMAGRLCNYEVWYCLDSPSNEKREEVWAYSKNEAIEIVLSLHNATQTEFPA